MGKFLHLLDGFAESVLKVYNTSGWLRHNRTGLGLIAIIFFFVALFSDTHFGVLLFLGFIGMLNATPIVLAGYLALREVYTEKKLLDDKNYLIKINRKSQRGERLSEQEMRVYLANIQRKRYAGEKLTSEEFCIYLINNQEAMEDFLFKSNDNDFVSTLITIQKFLNKEDFDFLISKVPNRINRLRLVKN